MKVKIVKDNLMMKFQQQFDILFHDPEFGFRADDKLITQIIASLTYEYFQPNKSVIMTDVVSSGIYFLQEGSIEMSATPPNFSDDG